MNDKYQRKIYRKYLFSFFFLFFFSSLLFYQTMFVMFSVTRRIYAVNDSPPIAQHVIYQASRHQSIIRLFSTSFHYFISIYFIHLIRLLSLISHFCFLTFPFLIKTTHRQSADLSLSIYIYIYSSSYA